jgi:nicotinamidase-related amidase
MSDESRAEEEAAALLAFALGPRPERITDALLAPQPPEVKHAVAAVNELMSTLARAEDPIEAPPALRARILASVAARRQPRRQALVVVDMINDHLTPGSTLEVPRAREIVPALRERIARARAEGVPVVYVVDTHDPDDSDMDFVDGWGAHNIAGTPGVEVWPDIAPAPGDRVVNKSTYSAFTQSKLEEVLDELKVDSLVLTGCLTELGLMATATAALERGYAVDVPADSQAGSHPDIERATLVTISAMAPYGPARAARHKKREARVA